MLRNDIEPRGQTAESRRTIILLDIVPAADRQRRNMLQDQRRHRRTLQARGRGAKVRGSSLQPDTFGPAIQDLRIDEAAHGGALP